MFAIPFRPESATASPVNKEEETMPFSIHNLQFFQFPTSILRNLPHYPSTPPVQPFNPTQLNLKSLRAKQKHALPLLQNPIPNNGSRPRGRAIIPPFSLPLLPQPSLPLPRLALKCILASNLASIYTLFALHLSQPESWIYAYE